MRRNSTLISELKAILAKAEAENDRLRDIMSKNAKQIFMAVCLEPEPPAMKRDYSSGPIKRN